MGEKRRLSVPAGIGTKIIMPILLVVSMFSIPAALAWRGMNQVQAMNEDMQAHAGELGLVQQLDASMHDSIGDAHPYDLSDPAVVAAQLQAAAIRSSKIANLQRSITDGAPGSWLGELDSLNQQTLTLLGNSQMAAAGSVDPAALESLYQAMNNIYSKLGASLERSSAEASITSNDATQDSAHNVIFTMVATGVIGISLAALLTRRIVRPVSDLATAAQGLSGGDFTQRVQIGGNDELTKLGHAFNNMASSLQIRAESLNKEQSKLRSVHQSITDGIVVFGGGGFIVSANPAAEAILGRTEADLAGSRTTGIPGLDQLLEHEELTDPDQMVRCWDYYNCTHDSCTAHKSEDYRCWLQCGEYCREEHLGCSSLKSDVCERCPVYRANACVSLDAEIEGRIFSIEAAPILNDFGETEGRLAVMHDITNERDRIRQFRLLYEIVDSIASGEDLQNSLQASLEVCIETMNARSGSIMLLDEDDSLVILAQKGLSSDAFDRQQHIGEGIAGWVAAHGEPLLLTDRDPDPRFPGTRNIRDAVCLPIRDENGVIGIMSLNERESQGGFTRENLEFLGPVAVQIGTAISRARLHHSVLEEKEKTSAIVESMGESLCVRGSDRTILFANPAHKQIFGEDCVGQTCYNVYVGRDNVCRGCPLDRCFETGDTIRRSHFVLDRLGNRRQLETTASPIRDIDGNIISCIEISRDVTEMLRIRDQAESRLNTLTTLFEVSNTLSSSLELKNILENFAGSALQAMRASSVSVMLFEHKKRQLVVEAVAGETKGWAITRGDIVDLTPYGLNGLISGSGPFCASTTAQMSPAAMSLAPPHSESVLVGRLSSRGKLLGLIAISSIKRSAFSEPGQMELFMDITNQAAVAIDNAEMYRKLEATFWSTIRSLAEAIDAKDAYTRGHSDRVADYAEALARRLELEEDLLNAVRCAGYLHDTGKIGIPDAILNKPGRLTEDEYSQIMRHPILSHKIIEPVEFPFEVKPLVRHHHERIDGSGYPDGLKGDAIPLGARIIGIADAFEAMTSDRPYRKALTVAAAADELQRCSGTQFDAFLVDEFIGYLQEGTVAND